MAKKATKKAQNKKGAKAKQPKKQKGTKKVFCRSDEFCSSSESGSETEPGESADEAAKEQAEAEVTEKEELLGAGLMALGFTTEKSVISHLVSLGIFEVADLACYDAGADAEGGMVLRRKCATLAKEAGEAGASKEQAQADLPRSVLKKIEVTKAQREFRHLVLFGRVPAFLGSLADPGKIAGTVAFFLGLATTCREFVDIMEGVNELSPSPFTPAELEVVVKMLTALKGGGGDSQQNAVDRVLLTIAPLLRKKTNSPADAEKPAATGNKNAENNKAKKAHPALVPCQFFARLRKHNLAKKVACPFHLTPLGCDRAENECSYVHSSEAPRWSSATVKQWLEEAETAAAGATERK
jgi:hypothetical protein